MHPRGYWFSSMMAATLKLLKSIKPAALDKPFTNADLSIIARLVVEWEDKARGLGLTEAEIDNIQNDFYRNSKMQKAAMMRTWKKKMAFKATLRELIAISGKHKWRQFIYKVCEALDCINTASVTGKT